MKKAFVLAFAVVILLESNSPAHTNAVRRQPLNGSYYYSTTNVAPPDKGWMYETIAGYVPTNAKDGAVPLYMSYSDGHEYFYSTFLTEGQGMYDPQGIACYAFSPSIPPSVSGTVALWRSEGGGYQHFYSTSKNEIANNSPFTHLNGIACYVYATQINGSVPLYRFRFTKPTDMDGTDHEEKSRRQGN
jgi:hypothetical protein